MFFCPDHVAFASRPRHGWFSGSSGIDGCFLAGVVQIQITEKNWVEVLARPL